MRVVRIHVCACVCVCVWWDEVVNDLWAISVENLCCVRVKRELGGLCVHYLLMR